MEQELLPKAYEPQSVEDKWYHFWQEKGFFHADPSSHKKPYTIIMPPPNVTGVLHMGHALVDTLQDILIRYKRMQGYETLWQPGTDHAGIATQTVVERMLMTKEGKRRTDYTREEFLRHIWRFVEENQSKILEQLKKLGCSCDWKRLRFTMDAKSNHAVRTAFKKFYEAGLIYRGDYLVNWDPVTQTALADDEVEHEEKNSSLWFFRYPLQHDKNQYIVIATTRPETMLGDTAVAVNPKDERYQSLISKTILLPLTGRPIPIVSDPFVDPTFGSGAVKITPAHDPNDYELAFRHKLPSINIMTPDGRINEQGGSFAGLLMEEARHAVVKQMQQLGLVEKIEPHKLRVGVSYRSKAIIQPYLSKQWFIKMAPFKKNLLLAVKEKRVELIPEHWEETYFHWIENLRDWCISRQLWWGHQIPIWYNKADPERMICHEGDDLPAEVRKHPEAWRQDEDVLDTWFSAALWPFTALGWPDATPELKKFYPTATLITGHDILFFWVARMVMMGEYFMGDVPFQKTFIHGLIYGKSYWREKNGAAFYVSPEEKVKYDLGDALPQEVFSKWEKMSKSKGNIIDPLEIIDSYGTDAMRMALASSVTFARQIDLDRRRFEEYKNFANKIWNGARFIFMNIRPEKGEPLTLAALEEGLNHKLLTLEDRWILSRLNRTIRDVTHHLDGYSFDKAATLSYEFFWKDFCAYYLELVKPVLFGREGEPDLRRNKQILLLVALSIVCLLLHPMAPFITEEIFFHLKQLFPHLSKKHPSEPYARAVLEALGKEACMVAPFPKVFSEKDMDAKIEENFAFMEKLIHAVRNIRSELKIPLGDATDLHITGKKNSLELKIAEENKTILSALLRLGTIAFEEEEKNLPHGFGSTAIVGHLKLFVPLPQHLREKERERLNKEQEKLLKIAESTRQKLDNQEFKLRAPKEVIAKLEGALRDSELALQEIIKKLSQM